jgi:thioredoxin reductase (NADPH)
MASEQTELIVYGASWCPDCRRAKEFLGNHRIPYRWIDLETNPEKTREIEELNGGKRIIPTIIFPDGSFISEPSNDELADRLNLSRAAQAKEYDVVIIGAGPTGLTTAIYAARENSRVLMIEKSAPGGQAGITERLDNYPGFPEGVGGAELADRITRQARRYDVEILQAVAVTSIQSDSNRVIVTTSIGESVEAKAVLVSSGSTYRRTGAEGEANLIGAGIHFCATCDGPFYKGAADLVVVGGGNSGLEEGLFLTQFADRVTVVQSSEVLSASKLLQDKVLSHPKMRVLTNVKVAKFNSDDGGKLESISIHNLTTNAEQKLATSGAFIFVGLDPNTSFLSGQVTTDDRGFIITDQSFRTNITGVFAAGDVRAGSTKQLASAVGEGAAAAIQIRYHLDALSNHSYQSNEWRKS